MYLINQTKLKYEKKTKTMIILESKFTNINFVTELNIRLHLWIHLFDNL